MVELNASTVSGLPPIIEKPAYDRSKVSAGIAHFSVGNFHRAHQAVYLDRCLARPGQEEWGIVGIGLMDDERERAKARIMPQQNGLYTLTEYPPMGNPTIRVIGSLVEYLHAPGAESAVLDRICDPKIRIVSMTVTEGGYNTDDATGQFKLDTPAIAHDLANPGQPKTVFGYVVEALSRRRASGIAPFTVMSCDNLRQNGDVARNAFLSFARARDPALADWIEANVPFPNCMVDRITPATTEVDAKRLNADSGVDDGLPVFGEDFIQWVVEDRFVSGRPNWEAVGVQVTDDVHGYEQIKLRMLNASHSMLCFPGLLMGYRLAHEAMADPNVRTLLDQFMERDAMPLLAAPRDMELRTYKDMVLARFGNPKIGDQLLRIASDGASKIPVFVQDTLRQSIEQGRDVRRLAFLIACFTQYVCGTDDNGADFPVVEPQLSQADLNLARQPGAAPLEMSPFQGWDLAQKPAFLENYLFYRSAIEKSGAKAVLSELLHSISASHAA